MRLKLMSVMLLLLAVALVFTPGSHGQQGKKKGGGMFPGMGGPKLSEDPDGWFDSKAQGKSYILISESGYYQRPFNDFAQKNGITDGKLTRQHVRAMAEEFKTMMSQKGNFKGGPKGGGPQPGTNPGATAVPFVIGKKGVPTPNPATQSADSLNEMALQEFTKRDENSDKKLNREEMPGWLRDELTKWDKDNDTLIDFDEFKAAFVARMQERFDREAARNPLAAAILLEEDWDKRPTVFRAGKLPKELPKWFEELDLNKDGQVSLAEWLKGEKTAAEYGKYDFNDDGLLTPYEVLKGELMAKNGGVLPKTAAADTTGPTARNPYAMGKKGGGPPSDGGEGKKKNRKKGG